MMKAIVCLPTRNEKDSIQAMIDQIQALHLPLFISDQNSTDGTIALAQKNHINSVMWSTNIGSGQHGRNVKNSAFSVKRNKLYYNRTQESQFLEHIWT